MRLLSRNKSLPLHFEPFEGTLEEWGKILDTYPDREIFQTPAWIRFLAESQQATPAIAVLKDRNDTVGHFVGLTVEKLGLKILGSPFIGWTTNRMGLRLLPDIPIRPTLCALLRYAFRDLGCVHLELADLQVRRTDTLDLGFRVSDIKNHFVDLTASEDQIYGNMNRSARRYCNRGGPSRGLTVEEASNDDFADEYYSQLTDVFGRQGLIPTFERNRTRLLINHLRPTGNLLLLRTLDSEGRCVATGIFFGMNRLGHFWGNASWGSSLKMRPNEPLHWRAMMHWKARGAVSYEMGGGSYTTKYGAKPSEDLRFRTSKYRCIGEFRDWAAMGFVVYQWIAGRRGTMHQSHDVEL